MTVLYLNLCYIKECYKGTALYVLCCFCCRYPVSYAAYFAAGSDPEFSVSPSTGELLPVGTNGSMIRISFLPSVYGKIYTGKLIIQVSKL